MVAQALGQVDEIGKSRMARCQLTHDGRRTTYNQACAARVGQRLAQVGRHRLGWCECLFQVEDAERVGDGARRPSSWQF